MHYNERQQGRPSSFKAKVAIHHKTLQNWLIGVQKTYETNCVMSKEQDINFQNCYKKINQLIHIGG